MKKPMRIKQKRILPLLLALAMLCAGCGKQEPEQISDYGGAKKTGAESSVSTEEGGITAASESNDTQDTGGKTPDMDTAGAYASDLPRSQRDGKALWSDTLDISGKPVEIGITTLNREMDNLHSYRIREVTADQTREQETVKRLFGDTAKERRDELSLENGDSTWVILNCQSFLWSFHPEEWTRLDETRPVPAWEDAEEYYFHTYEGIYMDVPCQMYFVNDHGLESLAFFPKNPGDAIGEPSCTEFEPLYFSTEGIGSPVLYGVNVVNAMSDRPNRTQSSAEALIRSAAAFAKEKLQIPLLEEDMSLVMNDENGYPVKTQLLFLPKEAEKSKTLEGAVLDGYSVRFDLYHTGESFSFNGDVGDFYVTDNGVVGCYISFGHQVEDVLSDRVQVLPFEKMMEAFREIVRTTFDPSKINGQKLQFRKVTLEYYPVQSNEDSTEYTLVPAWDFIAESNGEIGRVYVNAIDGSHICNVYLQR